MCVALSPDGGRAITASKDGTMRVWNTAVRYQLQVWRWGWLVGVSWHRILQLFCFHNKKSHFSRAPPQQLTGLTLLSPIAALLPPNKHTHTQPPQEDPKVLLKADLPLPPGSCFERMAWGPDGTIAAALGGHIHFIDSSSGKVLEVLHAHEGGITALRWSPRRVSLGAGQEPVAVLASASTDRRVRVWRTPARQ
jgi:hypothetical protein